MGCILYLLPGRPKKSTLSIYKEIGASPYIISGNGSIVYNDLEKNNIFEGFLDRNKVLEISKMCEENSIYYNVYTEDEIITKVMSHNILFYHKENDFKYKQDRTNITIVENVKEYIEKKNINNFLKITICDENTNIFNRILAKIKQIEDIEILETGYMSRKVLKYEQKEVEIKYNYTEITKKGINKWIAIQNLAKYLQIPEENIMTIGDNVNDAQMLINSGISVAMGNAWDNIKAISRYVTDTNENDGVAKAIEKYALSNYTLNEEIILEDFYF